MTLWKDNRGNRAPLVATIVLRLLLGVSFVMFVIAGLFKMSVGLVFGVAVLLVTLMILYPPVEEAVHHDSRGHSSRICGTATCVPSIWERRNRSMRDVCCRATCT